MSSQLQMRQFSPYMKKGQGGENCMKAFYVWYEKGPTSLKFCATSSMKKDQLRRRDTSGMKKDQLCMITSSMEKDQLCEVEIHLV